VTWTNCVGSARRQLVKGGVVSINPASRAIQRIMALHYNLEMLTLGYRARTKMVESTERNDPQHRGGR
jgi:hypothetical protein